MPVTGALKRQYELGKEQEEALRIRNFQFDTAINNMSQGLCFFDADHRLIVANDRFVEMYDIPPGRVGPGSTVAEIVDLRYEAGSFPMMSRDEYLHWRTNVAATNEAKDSIVELIRPFDSLTNGLDLKKVVESRLKLGFEKGSLNAADRGVNSAVQLTRRR